MDADAVSRLRDLVATRAEHPQNMIGLSTFGSLSSRERAILRSLFQTLVIELDHAMESDRQARQVKTTQRIWRVQRAKFGAA